MDLALLMPDDNVGLLFTDQKAQPLPNANADAASDSDGKTYDPDDRSNGGSNDDYNSDVEDPPMAGVDDDHVIKITKIWKSSKIRKSHTTKMWKPMTKTSKTWKSRMTKMWKSRVTKTSKTKILKTSKSKFRTTTKTSLTEMAMPTQMTLGTTTH
jgi:hypothetical protein